MGLLDSILGSAEAKGDAATGGSNQLVGALGGLLTQNGGIQGLMNKFSQGGLGETFCSWVGLGENQAISADQIQQVLGSQQVTALAAKLGVDPVQASSFLADYLPKIVDKLTPTGQVDAAKDHQAGLASLLPSLLQSLGSNPRGAGSRQV